MPQRDIIVIGASAGGVQGVIELARGLPKDFPAAVFVVIHVSASSPGILPQLVNRTGPLPAEYARHGDRVRRGRIYFAPPDHHLLLEDGQVHLGRGPRENGFRPAVDALFRTASRAYGPRVVGVVLSGGLGDGTLGLGMIKQRGGIAIVQDPKEAIHPSMPASALQAVRVDQVLPVAQMAGALAELARTNGKRGRPMRVEKSKRGDVAELGDSAMLPEDLPGPPSGFVCPECGGALWELEAGELKHYRCHVGHAFTGEALLNGQAHALEEALWTALRVLEESSVMRRRLADRAAAGQLEGVARSHLNQIEDLDRGAALIREMLLGRGLRKTGVGPGPEGGEAMPNSRPKRAGRKKIRKRHG